MNTKNVKLVVFVPLSHCDIVRQALGEAGAGKIGNYDCCSFELKGLGQFRALEGSNPFIGKQNEVELVEEYKVEMVVEDHLYQNVIAAMKKAHPYETPAYDVIQLEKI